MYILKLNHSFDAAHRLEFHNGKCRNLHGHQWQIIIEIKCKELNKNTMVVDFGDIKRIINEFDHKTILKHCKENVNLINTLREMNCEMIILNDSPTAENIANELKQRICKYSGFGDNEVIVTVFESLDSSITYK